MTVLLNRLAWLALNPLNLGLAGAAAGFALAFAGRGRLRRVGAALLAFALAWLWFLSTAACACLLGLPLERPYLAAQTPEALPEADAIVLLGGGVAKAEGLANPELFEASDRVWHAARLYRAGKAPKVVVSGCNDLAAAVPLLMDLGVPREAIAVDNESRNTYENSRFTERLLGGGDGAAAPRLRVLLVTSAWHMPRALGNFSRTSLEVAPAACDFKAHFTRTCVGSWWDWLLPSADSMNASCWFAKEWLGRLARK